MTRQLILAGAFAVISVIAGLAATTALAASADSLQVVTVDGGSAGRTFDGIGGVSAGASSRLLIDYPTRERSQILDYLFKPGYGAAQQILKVEIGGDTNSTDGTEPSHMRSPDDLGCDRGYEWWLMEQAKARNPNVKLYGLEWGAPGWVGNGTNTVWTSQNISYILTWLGCARQHHLNIDYLGGWNERAHDADWYVKLRDALDAHGYSDVQIVADDGVNWSVVDDLANDAQFNAAVSVVGVHYPCGYPNGSSCPSPSVARSLDKPLWASEVSNALADSQSSYNDGAAGLARDVNRVYTDGKMTGLLTWAPVWSAYDGFPFSGSGLLLANTPWSGNYRMGKSVWVFAHTTQFAEPGWRYVDSGSERLSGGGSVVTLRSPSGSDWSSVVETTDASAPQQLSYDVKGGLSTGTVHVWATNLNSGDQSDWFDHVADIQPKEGSFKLTVQPGYIYSLTTTTGQHKGTASPPAAQPMALPYSDSFDRYPADALPRYFADLGGSFQTAPCTGRDGMCLQQQVTEQPVQWSGVDNFPVTVVGDPNDWHNYQAQIDAYLPSSGHVELDGRVSPPQRSASGWAGYSTGLQGYHFRVGTDGHWSLYRESDTGTKDTTLAAGTASVGVGSWHHLALRFRGDEITASLDGSVLASVVDDTFHSGQVGLEGSRWVKAQFDDFHVSPMSVPSGAKGPDLSPVNPSRLTMARPGDSATVSTAVSNPGQLPATAVSARLRVPAGWSATMQTPAVGRLAPGDSAPLSWRISAPTTAAPGTYEATVEVTYQEGGLSWIATATVTIHQMDPAVIPQSQMTATATSSQEGYPASNAIDGDPNTLWHTQYSPTYDAPPQSITLDLGGSYDLTGLRYLPRQDGTPNGIVTSYRIDVSQDGTNFTQASSGDWAFDQAEKDATFSADNVRYVRLDCLAGSGAQAGYPQGFCSAAEINILRKLGSTQKASASTTTAASKP